MHCKKRNEPDGLHRHSSLPPKRLMYMQHPQAELGSSLESEPSCFVKRSFAAPFAEALYSVMADCTHAVAVGKRCCTRSWQIVDVEECSKRSRKPYLEATVSGVTFQKYPNLHHARDPDAESDSASVRQHMGSCHDSVCLNSKRLKLDWNENEHGIRCNQTDADKHKIRCNETHADKHATFICSRVQESSGNLLPIARQGTRGNAFSSISCCGQSRDGSHSNSRNASFLSHVRDSSNNSLTHLGKSEAVSGAPNSSNHVVISFKESLHAPAINTKTSPPSYILSSGRLSLEEEARLGRRAPRIDDDFEEYFSSLML